MPAHHRNLKYLVGICRILSCPRGGPAGRRAGRVGPASRYCRLLLPPNTILLVAATRTDGDGMGRSREPSFGELLSRYRGAAGFTQEELAERAGLSVGA